MFGNNYDYLFSITYVTYACFYALGMGNSWETEFGRNTSLEKLYTTGFNPIATHGQSLSWAAGNTDLMADPFGLKLDGSGETSPISPLT